MSTNKCSFRNFRVETNVGFLALFITIFYVMLWAAYFSNVHKSGFNHPTETHFYDFELCIMTRVKNVPSLMNQWIEYHHLAGVDQVFIADDCSMDAGKTRFWANFYVRLGIVSYFPRQLFNNCTHHNKMNSTVGSPPLYDFLFQKAKSRCKWLTVMDPDEYIFPTNEKKLLFGNPMDELLPSSALSLQKFLRLAKNPIFRLPWCMSSNMGRETIPTGLLIDNYPEGMFEKKNAPNTINTLMKTQFIKRWNFSHAPTEFFAHAPNVSGHPMKIFAGNFNVTHGEIIDYVAGGQICRKPIAPLFLKHFMIISWEDYVRTRASRVQDADGNLNPWALRARETWESWNFTSSCPQLGQRYAHIMSRRVMASIRDHIAQFKRERGFKDEDVDMDAELERYFRGDVLRGRMKKARP